MDQWVGIYVYVYIFLFFRRGNRERVSKKIPMESGELRGEMLSPPHDKQPRHAAGGGGVNEMLKPRAAQEGIIDG